MSELWSNLKFYGRCICIVCHEWWRKIFPVVVAMFVCGCVNLYTRWPTTDEKITMVYQCSL